MVSPLSAAAAGSEANESATVNLDDAVREVRPLRKNWLVTLALNGLHVEELSPLFSLLEATELEVVYLDGQGLEQRDVDLRGSSMRSHR